MSTTPVSFGGLESGLDTSAIISAEMAIYEQPLNSLKTEQTALTTQISDYQTINSQLLSRATGGRRARRPHRIR